MGGQKGERVEGHKMGEGKDRRVRGCKGKRAQGWEGERVQRQEGVRARGC